MGRMVSVAAVALALLGGASSASGARAAPSLARVPSCRFPGALGRQGAGPPRRAPRDARARVFFLPTGRGRPDAIYGCADGVGRAVRLGTVADFGARGGSGVGAIALAGTEVAVAVLTVHQFADPVAVELYDLRTGRRRWRWSGASGSYDDVSALVLGPGGTAAWVGDQDGTASDGFGIFRADRAGTVRELAFSDAQPTHLVVRDGHVTWSAPAP
ncbi:MAG TPA: hypothetical protein VHX88_15000 [Solirubrobacteraceae bacterium]|jgi:hypothetical protein|nr:hypothetical protein [Solirubrobacteraceae bacterium]